MSAAATFGLTAKLPLLGPLIGWTRRAHEGRLVARVWIRVDDTEALPAVAAASALFERRGNRVRPGSAQLWPIVRFRIPGDEVPIVMHFAIADVATCDRSADDVIRVLSLHREGRAGRKPACYEVQLCPERRGVLSLDALPIPLELDTASLLPEPAAGLEPLIQALLSDLDDALVRRRNEAAAPIPKTLSHKRLRSRSLGDCEAALSPATRAQLGRNEGELSFAVTCCRHPGLLCERELSRLALQALSDDASRPEGPAFALLVGDQIYADATGGVLDAHGHFEKYALRYEDAFGAGTLGRIGAGLPLYMAADDHEVGEAWSLSSLYARHLSESTRARAAQDHRWAHSLYLAHQRLMGPDVPNRARNWYSFDAAGAPFFVMDTRFERLKEQPGTRARLCEDAQRAALRRWLVAQCERERSGQIPADVPKFIVSGSVFAPGLRAYRDDPAAARSADNWQAFPRERAWLIKQIVSLRVRNVVFLSGDYHCAAVAVLRLLDPADRITPELHAYAVVSPPLFAPYPFANLRKQDICDHEQIFDPDSSAGGTIAEVASIAVEGEGFALLRIEREARDWAIKVHLRHVPGRGPCSDFCVRLVHGEIELAPACS